ncbi:MAG: glycosyltransferase, partial [Bryobacteraceae bacterium]
LATEAARLAGLPLQLSTDLEKDLPGAALFVYITQVEGLGSGVLLAMSAGVPVIASNTGGLPEIVTAGETGLLTSNEPREIAVAMMRLHGDPALSGRMAVEARRVVERRFTVASMISSTIGVYQQIHA